MAGRNESNEIRLTRVYDAPVKAVWDAWTVPEQVAQWWGPRGFTLTTHSKDLRAGGTWRYTMHGPDGTDYPNIATYYVVEPYRKLVYDHGATDDRPPLFRVTVTFTEVDGKTTMDMVSTLPTAEAARQIAKFIKQAGGNATWDRLAEHLAERATGRQPFVITRTFDAPIARVFEMWTTPGHLEMWLPPTGTSMKFLTPEIQVGRSARFTISGAHGTMHVRTAYVSIEPPRLIVYDQSFVDAQEQPIPAPGATAWPATLRTIVLLTEEAPDRTRVTVTSEPLGEVTALEREAFVHERTGMTRGWTGSFDALDALLERVGTV
ncbi:MAG: SRPBCC family protein [Vicinamibacterales bacterium]